MDERLSLTYCSDVLCVWAHIAQARVDEVARKFAGQVSIDYRFCSVFGDSAHKIRVGWADRGGYTGFQADDRDSNTLMVQGSPTFILNDGRQKLYGNVGYGVLEANITELLRSPAAGAASWC